MVQRVPDGVYETNDRGVAGVISGHGAGLNFPAPTGYVDAEEQKVTAQLVQLGVESGEVPVDQRMLVGYEDEDGNKVEPIEAKPKPNVTDFLIGITVLGWADMAKAYASWIAGAASGPSEQQTLMAAIGPLMEEVRQQVEMRQQVPAMGIVPRRDEDPAESSELVEQLKRQLASASSDNAMLSSQVEDLLKRPTSPSLDPNILIDVLADVLEENDFGKLREIRTEIIQRMEGGS